MLVRYIFSCFIICLLTGASCSITNPYKKTIFIPAHVHSLYVFTFVNETKLPGIQDKIRKELQNYVAGSSKVALSRDLRFADSVLQGTIKKLFIQEINRTAAGRIDKARYCLVVEFSLKDVVRNEMLMTNQSISVIQKIQLQTPPVTDMVMAREQIISNISYRIIRYCTTGERDDFNLMYGFEDKPLIEDDGTLIGKKRANYDRNNDGIDDRLQKNLPGSDLTNTNNN